MLNLDTHILVFAIKGELRSKESELLARNRWSVSAIVLWELAKLDQIGRIRLDFEDRKVKRVLSQIHVWPLDLPIARASVALDFRGDPADEVIAATSVIHEIPLLTRDKTIRQSKLVPLAVA